MRYEIIFVVCSEEVADVEAVERGGDALELILITSFIYFRRAQGAC